MFWISEYVSFLWHWQEAYSVFQLNFDCNEHLPVLYSCGYVFCMTHTLFLLYWWLISWLPIISGEIQMTSWSLFSNLLPSKWMFLDYSSFHVIESPKHFLQSGQSEIFSRSVIISTVSVSTCFLAYHLRIKVTHISATRAGLHVYLI